MRPSATTAPFLLTRFNKARREIAVFILSAQRPIALAFFWTMLLFSASAQQHTHFTIEQVYREAMTNYPLIRQRDLLTKTRDYSVDNAAKGYLPGLSFAGQASYQSDVTAFPVKLNIPGLTIPTLSKDQYKVYAELDQVIYDGGNIRNQKEAARTTESIQQKNLDVELYALYDRLNQIYFGVLLMDAQLEQNVLLRNELQDAINKMKARVDNGTAYRSSVDELKAELGQAEQSRIEEASFRRSYLDMLGLFVNMKLGDSVVLERPPVPLLDDSIRRPELLFYDYQKKSYDLQDETLNIQLRPKFSAFLQGGYARPGLNFLSNNFAWYYIGGIRLSWELGSLYTLKNQRQILDLDRKSLDVQKETFLFNTRLSQSQESEEITKYLDLVKTDDEIINLRRSVKDAATAQLENGVLSSHDYLSQVTAENNARRLMILHQMQLLLAQYNYQFITGNTKY